MISKAAGKKSLRKRNFGYIALFSKIIKPLAESCTEIRFAERSKLVYIWPKLHGSQSLNVRSYSSVINEENNVSDSPVNFRGDFSEVSRKGIWFG